MRPAPGLLEVVSANRGRSQPDRQEIPGESDQVVSVPLLVIGEVVDWQGHSPEELEAVRDGLERLRQQGGEPID